MNYRSDINAFEAAVLRDMWHQGRLGHGTEAARPPRTVQAQSPLPTARIWLPNWGGFSGWTTVGYLDLFENIGEPGFRVQNNRIYATLGLPNNPPPHLLYRLVDTKQSNPRKSTLYIGSAKNGQVAQRLKAHVKPTNKKPNPNRPRGELALRYFYSHTTRRENRIKRTRVDVGYVTNQQLDINRRSLQDWRNYNTVYLMEKILQRRYVPYYWHYSSRTFDEASVQERLDMMVSDEMEETQ